MALHKLRLVSVAYISWTNRILYLVFVRQKYRNVVCLLFNFLKSVTESLYRVRLCCASYISSFFSQLSLVFIIGKTWNIPIYNPTIHSYEHDVHNKLKIPPYLYCVKLLCEYTVRVVVRLWWLLSSTAEPVQSQV